MRRGKCLEARFDGKRQLVQRAKIERKQAGVGTKRGGARQSLLKYMPCLPARGFEFTPLPLSPPNYLVLIRLSLIIALSDFTTSEDCTSVQLRVKLCVTSLSQPKYLGIYINNILQSLNKLWLKKSVNHISFKVRSRTPSFNNIFLISYTTRTKRSLN